MNPADLAVLPSDVKTEPSTSWRDMVGIVASVGCAIHCAAMPFVIAYLPALGLSFLADEAFHKWMALICFLIAIAAFLPGLKRHGSWLPVGIGSVGLVFITFAAFGLAGECCHSCEVAKANAAVGESGDCENCEVCEHCDDCEHCKNEETATTDVSQTSLAIESHKPAEDKDWLSLLAPWITPFGGLVLVSAHLLNHRLGCSCNCCGSVAKS